MSATISNREATESFFEFGEADPRVIFGGVFWGDTPEVEEFEAFFFGVENGGAEDGDVGGEVFIFGVEVGAGLHVVAGVGVVEEEGSADDFVGEMGKIKGGEGLV